MSRFIKVKNVDEVNRLIDEVTKNKQILRNEIQADQLGKEFAAKEQQKAQKPILEGLEAIKSSLQDVISPVVRVEEETGRKIRSDKPFSLPDFKKFIEDNSNESLLKLAVHLKPIIDKMDSSMWRILNVISVLKSESNQRQDQIITELKKMDPQQFAGLVAKLQAQGLLTGVPGGPPPPASGSAPTTTAPTGSTTSSASSSSKTPDEESAGLISFFSDLESIAKTAPPLPSSKLIKIPKIPVATPKKKLGSSDPTSTPLSKSPSFSTPLSSPLSSPYSPSSSSLSSRGPPPPVPPPRKGSPKSPWRPPSSSNVVPQSDPQPIIGTPDSVTGNEKAIMDEFKRADELLDSIKGLDETARQNALYEAQKIQNSLVQIVGKSSNVDLQDKLRTTLAKIIRKQKKYNITPDSVSGKEDEFDLYDDEDDEDDKDKPDDSNEKVVSPKKETITKAESLKRLKAEIEKPVDSINFDDLMFYLNNRPTKGITGLEIGNNGKLGKNGKIDLNQLKNKKIVLSKDSKIEYEVPKEYFTNSLLKLFLLNQKDITNSDYDNASTNDKLNYVNLLIRSGITKSSLTGSIKFKKIMASSTTSESVKTNINKIIEEYGGFSTEGIGRPRKSKTGKVKNAPTGMGISLPGQRGYGDFKMQKDGQFGNVWIDPNNLKKMVLTVYDNKGKRLSNMPIPYDLYHLITKRYDSRRNYSNEAVDTFNKLLKHAGIPFSESSSKKIKKVVDDVKKTVGFNWDVKPQEEPEQQKGGCNGCGKCGRGVKKEDCSQMIMVYTDPSDMVDRLNVLIGELSAKNDSESIPNEASQLIDKLKDMGEITDEEAKDLMKCFGLI